MLRNRRFTLLIGLVLAGLLLAACGGAAPAEEEAAAPTGPNDLGGREVRIMVENAYPPFNYIDPDTDEPVGWDYDVWREICNRINCEPVFVEGPWPPFEMVAAGEVDVAADGITLKMSRSMVVDYSDPYIEYGMTVLTRADSDLTDEDAVLNSDAILGTQQGTTNEAIALTLVGGDESRVKNFGEFPLAVEALLAGDVDGVPLDEVAAVAYLQENPDELKAAFAATSGELLAFVFANGSDLIPPVNYAVQEMLNDGSLDAICQEWLLRDCSTTPTVE